MLTQLILKEGEGWCVITVHVTAIRGANYEEQGVRSIKYSLNTIMTIYDFRKHI